MAFGRSPYPHAKICLHRYARGEKSLAEALRLYRVRKTLFAIETKRANAASWSAWASRLSTEPSGGAGFEERDGSSGSAPERLRCSPVPAHGQGHETVFAQVTAEKMGVSMDHVAIRHGDTLVVQQGVGTFGSRSAIIGGGAW